MLLFMSFIFGISVSLLTLFVLQKGYFFSSSLKLKEVLTQITYLYPKQSFFGYRILYIPENQSIENELKFMGLKKIREIESDQFDMWINEHFDIFIAVKVGPKTDLIPLEIQDIRLGSRLFYAYESIITLPIDLSSEHLTQYTRKLSLVNLSSELSTSIWITGCESIPGYLDVSEILPKDFHFQAFNQKSTLKEILDKLQVIAHEKLISHIPPAATASLKAEQLAIPHQLRTFFNQVSELANGSLKRSLPIGYVLFINDNPSHDLVDHLYSNWRVSSIHQHNHINNYSMPWISNFIRTNHDSQSLYGIYLAISLFSIFSLSITYISRNYVIPGAPLMTASINQNYQSQLFSEIAASNKLSSLIKLMSLHKEMMNTHPSDTRCKQYQSLVDPIANCASINHTKMSPLPDDLIYKIRQFSKSLTREKQLNALTGTQFLHWQTKKFDKELSQLDTQSICQLDKSLGLHLLPSLASCSEDLTSELVNLFVTNKTKQIIQSSIPFHADDDFNVIANTAHYFEENPRELLGNYSQDLTTLKEINDKIPLNYQTLSELKSLAHLAKDREQIKVVFHDVNSIAKSLSRSKDLGNLINIYQQILSDRWHIKSLLNEPDTNSFVSWKKAIFTQLLTAVKRRLSARINEAWKPLHQAYQSHIQNFYPIALSGKDVNIAAFNELIGPAGRITQFFQQNIEPLVDSQKRTWAWDKDSPFDLHLDNTLINSSMQFAILSEMYFHKKSSPWLEFTVSAKAFSPQLTSATWQIADQSLNLSPAKQAELVVWSSDQSSFSIITLNGTNGAKKQISFQGALSLFRLFDEARIIPGANPQQFSIRVQKDSWWAEFEIHLPHSINPLLNTAARKIQLNANIVEKI